MHRSASSVPFVIPSVDEGSVVLFPPRFAQVNPWGVGLFYEGDFLRARPAFDLFLPFDGVAYILKMFKPYQPLASIICREPWNSRSPVFCQAALEIVGHSAIQNVRSAGNHIHVVMVVSLH